MLTTSQLTLSERLLLSRRRDGNTQTQAAAKWGISEWDYRMRESGQRNDECPPVRLQGVQPHEACFLMRRRAGIKRTELANTMDVSCWWLTQMERGKVNPKRLIEFWS